MYSTLHSVQYQLPVVLIFPWDTKTDLLRVQLEWTVQRDGIAFETKEIPVQREQFDVHTVSNTQLSADWSHWNSVRAEVKRIWVHFF